MKIACQPLEAPHVGTRVVLSGVVAEEQYGCLQRFWEKHLLGSPPFPLPHSSGPATSAVETLSPPGSRPLEMWHLDCRQVEEMDAVAVAVLTTFIRAHLHAGGTVVLEAPPQMLSHTLYKMAALVLARLRLVDARVEEPYAG